MKTKGLFIALLLMLVCATSYAQSNVLNSAMQDLANDKNITTVKISSAMLKMVPDMIDKVDLVGNGIDISSMVKKMTQLDIYTSDNPQSIQKLRAAIGIVSKHPKCDNLMLVREEETEVAFYAEQENENLIKALYMFVDDEGDCVLMRILGSFTMEDIQGLIESTM